MTYPFVLTVGQFSEHEQRQRALRDAAEKLLRNLLGCQKHEMSEPIARAGVVCRVCLNCGAREDLARRK